MAESSRQRVLISVLGVFLFMSTGGALYALQLNRANVQKFEGVQAQLRHNTQELKAQNARLQAQTEDLSEKKETLNERLSVTQRDLSQVQSELERTREEVSRIMSRAETLQEERDTLLGHVDELTAHKASLERTTSELRAQLARQEKTAVELRDSVSQLEAKRKELEQQLRNATAMAALPSRGNSMGLGMPYARERMPQQIASTGLDRAMAPAPPMENNMVMLPPIIVQRNTLAPRKWGPLQGEVVGVNERHAFTIVDKGIQDGIQVGDRFVVSRRGRPLGVIEAIRVRQTVSACDISQLQETQRMIRLGDAVEFAVDEE